ILPALLKIYPEFFMHLFIEVLKEVPAREPHGFVYLGFKFLLKGIKGGLYLVFCSALLIDLRNPFFKINAGLDDTQDLIACAKNAFEEFEFFREKLVYPLVCRVLLIQEVHNHHIVLLSVTVTSPYPLFNPLRIPRQVIIYNKRTKLQINPLGSRFGGNHDYRFIPEVVPDSGPHVCTLRTRNPVSALVPFYPSFINLLRLWITV